MHPLSKPLDTAPSLRAQLPLPQQNAPGLAAALSAPLPTSPSLSWAVMSSSSRSPLRRLFAWLTLSASCLLLGSAAWAEGQAATSSPTSNPFSFEQVVELARQRATLAAPPPAPPALPSELASLNYDQYRDIRFKPDHALWRKEGLPFELMYFHLGFYQTAPVRLHEVVQGQVKPLGFDPSQFDYGKNRLSPKQWGDIGLAGFRVHAKLNSQTYKDELIVFLGASYFRAIGAGQHYGLSARGLAVDTVGGQGGEEFPRFTEFWVERPTASASAVVIHALLESRRVTGAYRFEVRPGEDTVTEVQSRIFVRAGAQPPIATLGIAPLTSMYMFGENQPHRTDFRPEVHDSDGLMVHSGSGEWLWRPLINPAKPLTTSFAVPSLRGFGLMQRDRSFSSYEDVEARYERRPSAWVEPTHDWGAGRVELLQLPTPDETNDNIVAYWVPSKLPAAGEPLKLDYRIHWQGQRQQRPPSAWVVQTRVGRGFAELAPGEQQFIVDFAGPAIDKLPADAPLRAQVSAGANGRIVEQALYRNEAGRTWRLALRVQQQQPDQPVELRAFLQHQHDTVSETWSNILPAQR